MHNPVVEQSGYHGLRQRASLLFLVLVNMLPLAGVLFFHWDVAALVLLYWSENLVLGFYTLLKMLVKGRLAALGRCLFFCLHYGIFCAVHGVFIVTMLLDGELDPAAGGPLEMLRQLVAYAPPQWLLAFAALFISHGISFVLNFMQGPEREELSLKQLMAAPYSRIVVLHIAIIIGGLGVMALGQPVAMLAVLVLLKIALDVILHLREHRAITA